MQHHAAYYALLRAHLQDLQLAILDDERLYERIGLNRPLSKHRASSCKIRFEGCNPCPFGCPGICLGTV